MDASEAEELWIENAKLTKQNDELLKAVTILVYKQFDDCFNYVCDSQNECQGSGCRVQKKINEIRNQE